MIAAHIAVMGMVNIHAQTIFRAVAQRTALIFSTVPTPMIAPEITWVVDTGMPKCAVPMSTSAADDSAQNPSVA